MELLHRRRRARAAVAQHAEAGGGGGAAAGSIARGAGAGGGGGGASCAWRVWAAAERGAGAGHRTGRRRCGRWGEKVGREKRLGFEVDPRVVIVCTNLKHWKVSWKKSCGRWIGFLGPDSSAQQAQVVRAACNRSTQACNPCEGHGAQAQAAPAWARQRWWPAQCGVLEPAGLHLTLVDQGTGLHLNTFACQLD